MFQSSNLFRLLRQIGHLQGIGSLLSWDQETFMPSGAVHVRSAQHEALASLIHEQKTSLAYEEELKKFVDLKTGDISDSLSDEERACVRELYKDWKQSKALPADFVGKFARTVSESTHVWQQAREQNNFSLFAPSFAELVSLSRQKAAFLDPNKSTYDVLLDEYEPGMTAAVISPLFEELRSKLIPLLKTILAKQAAENPLEGRLFSVQDQWDFGVSILKEMGYDFERGRQDKSTHPFTIHFHPDDVRITTRFTESDFSEGFSSSIHEGGHALYEQGLRTDWFGTPIGEACSLGIHESQSRLWENIVCKGAAFWDGHFEALAKQFPSAVKGLDSHTFYKALNRVKPGFIRVEADEVTYNFHVMIRYEIEKALFNDNLDVEALPELWNQKYQEYLGITPPTNAEGVLQDVHWSCGNFGYFPTYTLGNLFSVMIFNKAESEIPGLSSDIKAGNLLGLKSWLNKTIHNPGRRYSSLELVERVTGEPLSVHPFITYLESKYL